MREKHVLIQLRDNKKNIIFPDKWGFFGGEIKIYEKHLNAIKRELKEELNIRNFKSLKFIFSFYEKKYNSLFFIYKLHIFEKFYLNEGLEAKFFNTNDIFNGGKSRITGKYHKVAELNLMKKILNYSKKFL